jgi:alpha/beta superfamily hydrolase
LKWFKDPREINRDTLNDIRRKATRHFWNKKGEYLKDKINELATVRTRILETYIKE